MVGVAGVLVGGVGLECRLVLFDLDGTLVGKEARNRALAETRYQAIRELVGEEAAERWAQLSGVNPHGFHVDDRGPLSKASRRDDLAVAAAAIWGGGYSWFQALEKAREAYRRADSLQLRAPYMVGLLPGVRGALEGLHRAGLLLGIATNGSGLYARELMRAHGVDHLFNVYVGSDEVGEGKPAPDMVLEACRRLGVEAWEALYVGDELVDAMAAGAAGCRAAVLVHEVEGAEKYVETHVAPVARLRAVTP